jgi:hypothetical protein
MKSRKHINDPVLEVPSNFREEDELAIFEDSADIEKLRSILEDKETVYRLAVCMNGGREAVLAATNKRIIFADKQFIGANVVSFSYKELAAIVYEEQITTVSMTLVHISKSMFLQDIDKEHGVRLIRFIESAIGQDYSVEGSDRTFRHNSNMLEITDSPTMRNEIKSNLGNDPHIVKA